MISKKEQSLRQRLHAAHSFIGGLKFEAKDYGSGFSSSVHYDCKKFLENNRPIKETKYTLIEKDKLMQLKKENLQLKIKIRRLGGDPNQ